MSSLSFIFFNNNGLQTLGRSNNDWFNVREQWVLSVFFFISSSGDSQSQSEWNTLDTSLPDFLVQSWVQTDFFSTHVQLGELLDFLDGSWSSLLEGNTVQLLKKTLVSIMPSCLYCEWTKKKSSLICCCDSLEIQIHGLVKYRGCLHSRSPTISSSSSNMHSNGVPYLCKMKLLQLDLIIQEHLTIVLSRTSTFLIKLKSLGTTNTSGNTGHTLSH